MLAVRQALEDTAGRHGIQFMELAVMPDHVHALVDCHPTVSQAKALNLLRGASAHYLFQHFPKLRLRYRKGHFWSPGKAGRTVGDIDKEKAIEYVRWQSRTNKTQ
ncbi:MAG: IS200/IS605 family transposase [archaeon]